LLLPPHFQEFTGYFLAQSGNYEIVMQPTSFSFSGPASYLVRTYEYPRAPFFITEEPGNLTQEYVMVYGKTSPCALICGWRDIRLGSLKTRE